MNEDRFPSTRKNDVRPTWKVSALQPESIAEAMQEATNSQFRASIAVPHAFHDA
jgi:hypothetical protein